MAIRVLLIAFSIVLVVTADNVASRESSASDGRSNVRPVFEAVYREGWFIFREKKMAYKVFRDRKTWAEADEACMSEGARLASIHDEEENDFIRIIAGNIPDGIGYEDQIWIAGKKKKDGSWDWGDGSFWHYLNWSPGEPNNAEGREDCLQLLAHPELNGKWNDYFCDAKLAFVCRKLW
ncbi:Lectin protein type II [Trichostrongylus colubriformis]|uniref:Lectin protein type II n=1 Tax=Trichostrongylus colubriformis TaxID=6319 RepID=A0AAN8IEI8_TRICO